MKLPPLLLLLSLIILPYLSFTSSARTSDSGFVEKACQEFLRSDPLLNHTFCINSLKAAPPGFSDDDRNLGVLAAQLALSRATATVSRIQELLKSGRWSGFGRECLSSCLDVYTNTAVPSLEKSVGSFGANLCMDANVRMTAAMDASTTCQDGFGEKKGGRESPLTRRNYDLFQLCAIGLAYSRLRC